MPHIPLHAPVSFVGKSQRGLYGDVIEELDWGIGEVLNALKDQGLEENTLVILFTIPKEDRSKETGLATGNFLRWGNSWRILERTGGPPESPSEGQPSW